MVSWSIIADSIFQQCDSCLSGNGDWNLSWLTFHIVITWELAYGWIELIRQTLQGGFFEVNTVVPYVLNFLSPACPPGSYKRYQALFTLVFHQKVSHTVIRRIIIYSSGYASYFVQQINYIINRLYLRRMWELIANGIRMLKGVLTSKECIDNFPAYISLASFLFIFSCFLLPKYIWRNFPPETVQPLVNIDTYRHS